MRKFENNKFKNNPNYIYGRIPSLNSLERGNVKKAFLQKGFNESKILDQLNKNNVQFEFVDSTKLDEMSRNGNHQGIIVEVKPFEYCSINKILENCKGKSQPLVLFIDEIEDPHNFGAILRSCDAFGVDGVVIKTRNQVPLNMTVAKVSTGAVGYVDVASVSNLNQAIDKFKENGFWIYAAEGSGKENYNQVKFDRPTVLIVGSEGRGVSKLVVDNSDFVIKIPMQGHVNSLNVSVSVGILLSRIRNK